jgi:hypothetical protein
VLVIARTLDLMAEANLLTLGLSLITVSVHLDMLLRKIDRDSCAFMDIKWQFRKLKKKNRHGYTA